MSVCVRVCVCVAGEEVVSVHHRFYSVFLSDGLPLCVSVCVCMSLCVRACVHAREVGRVPPLLRARSLASFAQLLQRSALISYSASVAL